MVVPFSASSTDCSKAFVSQVSSDIRLLLGGSADASAPSDKSSDVHVCCSDESLVVVVVLPGSIVIIHVDLTEMWYMKQTFLSFIYPG